MDSEAQIPRQYINGLSFPCSTQFTEENIKSALSYKPRDDDVIISTYPKSGTTWLQYIVYEILNDGEPPPTMDEMRKVLPLMEASGSPVAESLPPPRAIKYHLPYHLVPKNRNAKYINIFRNPADVVVSYYHFLKQVTSLDLDFNDLFQAFVEGRCVFGDYFDHILSWYAHKDDPNVLILSYDQMKQNPRRGLFAVAFFLGYHYMMSLSENEDLVEAILKHTSFDYMKTLTSYPGVKGANFLRKGSVGDWKNYLSEEQEKILRNRMNEKLKGTDIQKYMSF